MRFLLGFLSATIFIAIMIIGCWLYFDFSIDTNNEQQEQPVETSTQSLEQNNTQQPTKQKHNGVTPPNMKDNPQGWKEKYNRINEGTEEIPYVIINGRKVDPKHVIKNKHLPNLHNTEKAVELMKSERSNLSDKDKRIYDGVIETAQTNIINGYGSPQDYSYVNMYKQFNGKEEK